MSPLSLNEDEVELSFIRAGGPGGQNVNKVSSAVQLRFDVRGSKSLGYGVRVRLEKLAGKKLTKDGVIVLTANRQRTQEANKKEAIKRLVDMIKQACIVPKRRIATRPSFTQKRRRLEQKTRRSQVKKNAHQAGAGKMTDSPVEICGILELPDGRLMVSNEYGDANGKPVLVVHGTPGSRLMFQTAHDMAHARGLRLIAPDRPGYGGSSAHSNYTLLQWVGDVECLLDSLNIDHFAVMGVSGGGPFATALATYLPDRVRCLGLISPVGVFSAKVRQSWSWRNRLFFKFLPRAPFLMSLFFLPLRFLVRHAPGLPLSLFIRTLGRSDQLVLRKPKHAKLLLSAFLDGTRLGIVGVQGDLRLFSSAWNVPFEQAQMPIVLWQGLDDEMVPSKAAFELADQLPEVQVISMKEAGHFWIFDHVEEVLDSLEKSLGSHPNGPSR